MADRLEALMCAAISDWYSGNCRPYGIEQIRGGTQEAQISSTWPRHCDPIDLEWTSLLTAPLTEFLDQATAQYGGTWPLVSVSQAIALRLGNVLEHGPRWCPGELICGPALLELLMRGDGKAPSEGGNRSWARD